MGCGCRGKASNASAITPKHEVWRNDVYTGRRFASLPDAERYAARIGGTVKVA